MTSVRDIIIIAVILFIVGLSLVFVVNMNHRVFTALSNTTTFSNNTQALSVITHADTATNMSDYLYLALFIAFFISVIIFGWLVGGEPIMAPIYFVVVIIFAFVSVIIQLIWSEIVANAQLVSTMSNLPITNFIGSHLGYFVVLMGLIGIVVMYAKPSQNYYGGGIP